MTPAQRARYEAMVAAGESPRFAEVLALGAFPSIRGSSSVFMRGTHAQDSAYDDMRYRAAQAQGVDTNGKRYIAGLARHPNDPEAWVSDLSDVRRICEERGWGCEGAVDVAGYEYDGRYELPRDYEAAPDIVEERVQAGLEPYDAPEHARVVDDLRDRARAELSGAVDLTPEPLVAPYDDPFARPGMEEP